MDNIPSGVIEQVVEILSDSNISESEIQLKVNGLVQNEMSAKRLIVFIPEAFAGVYISKMTKAVLPNNFGVRNSKGAVVLLGLECEPIYVKATQIALEKIKTFPNEEYQKIISKSSMFDALSQVQKQGKELTGTFSPTIYLGIPAELYGYVLPTENTPSRVTKTKPWWRIW